MLGLATLNNRAHIENRDPDTAENRAVVLDYVLARILAWVFGGGFVAIIIGAFVLGVWVNTLSNNDDRQQNQINTLENSVGVALADVRKQIADRKADHDSSLEALHVSMQSQLNVISDRVRPLEITASSTATSLGVLRDQGSDVKVDIQNINSKLDRVVEFVLRETTPNLGPSQ
jgi:DNA-binding transcriptional MerR regulator